MGGFARTSPSYETPYKADGYHGPKMDWGEGYTFPCLFRNVIRDGYLFRKRV